jgi:hypothetical protein
MKPVRGGLRSKSNARETTGVLALAKSIAFLLSTILTLEEYRLGKQTISRSKKSVILTSIR